MTASVACRRTQRPRGLLLVAMPRHELCRLVVGGLCELSAVEIDNKFRFFPVAVFPSGRRSQVREEAAALGSRVADALEDQQDWLITATVPAPRAPVLMV